MLEAVGEMINCGEGSRVCIDVGVGDKDGIFVVSIGDTDGPVEGMDNGGSFVTA